MTYRCCSLIFCRWLKISFVTSFLTVSCLTNKNRAENKTKDKLCDERKLEHLTVTKGVKGMNVTVDAAHKLCLCHLFQHAIYFTLYDK